MNRWLEALATAMLVAPPSVWGGPVTFHPILGSAEPRVPVIERVVEIVPAPMITQPRGVKRLAPTLQQAASACIEWQGPTRIRDAAGFAAVYGMCLVKNPALGIASIEAPGAPDLLVVRRYAPSQNVEHLEVRTRGGMLSLIAISVPPKIRKTFTPLRAL
ncbi:MAG: hypothetical protein COB53_03040 [Elusimicrobia bacterium]|nr:MAG: hypothetical protein COB53_03040 [Elusimicrobiota bacterium]